LEVITVVLGERVEDASGDADVAAHQCHRSFFCVLCAFGCFGAEVLAPFYCALN